MAPTLLAILFAACALGLLTTYVFYPAFVVLYAALFRGRRPPDDALDDDALPSVTFLIAAYNEEEVIEEKLANTLAIDYPADKLEILVASDGSTDRTDELVNAHPDPRVKLVRNEQQGGKTATTNLAVQHATGDVLVFSDATGMFNEGSIRALVAPMADPSVGAVMGKVVYDYEDTPTAKGFRIYQRYVVAQRMAEPSLNTLTSVSGSIHAIRRPLWDPAPAHLSYDMVVPAMMAFNGARCAYADGATSGEVSRVKASDEFKARVRIALRAYAFVAWLWSRRARVQDAGYLLQLTLHKGLRWFSPHLLVVMLAAHAGLAWSEGGFWLYGLFAHAGGWLFGLWVWLLDRLGLRLPKSGPILLFCTAQAAFAVGFLRWLKGARVAAWTPDREAEARARGGVSEDAEGEGA